MTLGAQYNVVEDAEVNFVRDTSIIRGTRSQNDLRFSLESRNHQCTTNAAVAVAYSKVLPFSSWDTTIIDNILDYGDQLYKKSVSMRTSQNTPDLFVVEVYPNFIIANVFYSLRVNEMDSVTGFVGLGRRGEIDVPLAQGIERIFQNFECAIFTCGLLSTGLAKVGNSIYLFDSHSRDNNGMGIEEDGKACLLKFSNDQDLLNFMLQNYNNDYLYTLVPVRVEIGSVGDLSDVVDFHTLTLYENQNSSVVRSQQLRTQNISTFRKTNKVTTEQDMDCSSSAFPGKTIGITSHYLGPMNRTCSFCDALFFNKENMTCCNKGVIKIPEQSVYPDLLKALITNAHPQSSNFMKNIRRYNTLLALGSTSFARREGLASGAPVIVVSGQIYHRLSDVDTLNPSFGSLYFIDSGEATRKRTSNNVRDGCDTELLKQIDALLRKIHPFAQMYHNLGKKVSEGRGIGGKDEIPQYGLYFHGQPDTDRKKHAAPTTSNEIGGVFSSVDGDVPPPGSIRVYLIENNSLGQQNTYRDIPKLSPIVDALCYPLLFPHGELGWSISLMSNRSGKRITKREFECYRLMSRSGKFNPILFCGRLTQQFIVDKYVEVEGDRLHYLRTHQKKLRANNYVGLQDYVARKSAVECNEKIGRIVVLPSSFMGGARFMQQNYQDAMAIVAKFGRPSLFVTFTCNPNWREITENINSSLLNPQDRPEYIARVFELKRKAFFEDILKKKIFGEVIAFVYVIEFQKRGLPHMHCLIFLDDKDKLRNPEDVDKIICAELPAENSQLFQIIMSTMIHGPCGDRAPNAACMVEGVCSKKYPKSFSTNTAIDKAIPIYRRRNDGRTAAFTRNRIMCTVDNRDVVPYSPYLSQKYESHINVEVVTTVGAVKYVFKYINKGPDAAILQLKNEIVYDEIKAFIESRYISSGESAWRLLGFPIQGRSHVIYRLPVHLPGERVVYFEEGQEEVALQYPKLSRLEAYFRLNVENASARKFKYLEIPLYYSFNDQEHRWIKRRKNCAVIPRLYTISPKYKEKFHLRILLLHVAGPTSFEDLRTFHGVMYPTFTETVRARNLIASDHEWFKTLEHAALVDMPGSMRKLFAYMLCFCEIGNPIDLWENFKKCMFEDFIKKGYTERDSENRSLRRISYVLNTLGRNLSDFNLPEPETDSEDDIHDIDGENNPIERTNVGEFNPNNLNTDQRNVFDRVITALQSDVNDRYFYVQGSGGTGKTFIYNALLEYCEILRIPAIAVAFTGIAALLLKNGRTVHSTFRLPLDFNADTRSSITVQSEEAGYLRNLQLIIWDEISMVNYHVINIVDELLRDICSNSEPFGGKCILFGGDVKQLLPIAPGRVQQVELFFTNSRVWNRFHVLNLVQNMRVREGEEDFTSWLEDLGRGIINEKITKDGQDCNDLICLPNRCLTDNVVDEIYGELNTLTPEQLSTRAILCPKNDHCNQLNDRILDRFSGTLTIIHSNDSVVSNDEDEIANFPEEYLNTITPSGMPLHELRLKSGVPIILLRNLCLQDGLINGTRLLVSAVTDVLLTAEIVTGRFVGKKVLIPRMDLTSADRNLPFVLRRRQFPVKVCFALTINKAQGQTFDQVGIYLDSPVFSHGQLYVAFSRARSWNGVKVEIHHSRNQGKLKKSSKQIFTKNIVYSSILNSILI